MRDACVLADARQHGVQVRSQEHSDRSRDEHRHHRVAVRAVVAKLQQDGQRATVVEEGHPHLHGDAHSSTIHVTATRDGNT